MITVPRAVLQEFIAHARSCDPEEACGLFAGRPNGSVERIVPVTNMDHDPMHFTLTPLEHLRAQKTCRRSGLQVLGIVHSHPHGPDRLSREDVAQAKDPDMIQLLVSHLDRDEPDVKAFMVSADSEVFPVTVTVVP